MKKASDFGHMHVHAFKTTNPNEKIGNGKIKIINVVDITA